MLELSWLTRWPPDSSAGFLQCMRKIWSCFFLFRSPWVPFCQVISEGADAGSRTPQRRQTQNGRHVLSHKEPGGRQVPLSQTHLLLLLCSPPLQMWHLPLRCACRGLQVVTLSPVPCLRHEMALLSLICVLTLCLFSPLGLVPLLVLLPNPLQPESSFSSADLAGSPPYLKPSVVPHCLLDQGQPSLPGW